MTALLLVERGQCGTASSLVTDSARDLLDSPRFYAVYVTDDDVTVYICAWDCAYV
jgi:hypothetical protein